MIKEHKKQKKRRVKKPERRKKPSGCGKKCGIGELIPWYIALKSVETEKTHNRLRLDHLI